MKVVTTGVDAEGRSTIWRIETPRMDRRPGVAYASATIWETGLATATSRRQHENGDAIAPQLAASSRGPAITSWRVVEYEPGASTDPHRTDTVDYDTVLAGRVVLELEAASVELVPGDIAVVAGVTHAWRAGPEGCRLSAVMVMDNN